MYDWSSFSKDKEFTDAWREFLAEKKITDTILNEESDFYREKKKELEARKKAGDDAAAADRKAAGKSTLSDKLANMFSSGKEMSKKGLANIGKKINQAALALDAAAKIERAELEAAEISVRAAGWDTVPEAATAFDLDPEHPEDWIKKCGTSLGMDTICAQFGKKQKPEEEDTSAAAAGAAPGPQPEDTSAGAAGAGPESLDEALSLWLVEEPFLLEEGALDWIKDVGSSIKAGYDKAGEKSKQFNAAVRRQFETGHSDERDAKLALVRNACKSLCIYGKGAFTTKSGRDFFTRGLGISPSQAALGTRLADAFINKAREDARARMGEEPEEEPTEETPEEEEGAPDRGAVLREVRASDTWGKVLAAFEALVQNPDKSSARRLVEKFYGEDSSEEEKEDFARFFALVKGTPEGGGEADLSRDILSLPPSDELADELNLKHSDEVQGSAQEFKQSLGRIFQWGKEQFPTEEGFEGVELKAMSENVNLKLKNLIKEELLRVKNEER